MELYLSFYILQQKLPSAKTLEAIQNLFKQLSIRAEVQFFTSAFSNLTWEISTDQLTGRLTAHVITKIFINEESDKSVTSLTPTTLHFEAINPKRREHLEEAMTRAVRKSLDDTLKKLLR